MKMTVVVVERVKIETTSPLDRERIFQILQVKPEGKLALDRVTLRSRKGQTIHLQMQSLGTLQGSRGSASSDQSPLRRIAKLVNACKLLSSHLGPNLSLTLAKYVAIVVSAEVAASAFAPQDVQAERTSKPVH